MTPDVILALLFPAAFAVITFVLYLKRERIDRKSTRLNSSHSQQSRMPSSA